MVVCSSSQLFTVAVAPSVYLALSVLAGWLSFGPVLDSDKWHWMILPRVDVTDVGVDCTWNGFSALEVLFRPGAVSFTFGTWRLEGEACIHGVFMTVLLVAVLGSHLIGWRPPYAWLSFPAWC